MSTYQKLANAVTTIHLFWVFALSGGLAVALVFPWYERVQVVAATSTIALQLVMRGRCPLTKLEVWLRRKVYPTYQSFPSFIQYYLGKKLGINVPKAAGGIQLILTVLASWTLLFVK